MRWFTWPSIFDVTDAEEQPIGRIEEKYSWFLPTFQFITPSNFIQAEASLNFWGTIYTVVDPSSEEIIATMSRSFFRFKDDWTINIHNRNIFSQKEIDFRMFVVVMAFQSDRDAWRRQINSLRSMNARDSAVTDVTTSKPIEGIRTELEAIRDSINPIEPTEEDFEEVDVIVTNKLNEEGKEPDQEDESLSKLERGYKVLLPLLTQDELSARQKSALFLMMNYHLQSLK